MIRYEVIDEAEVTEPLSLAEAKAYCAIDQDYTQLDSIIMNNIRSARVYLEGQLNVGLAQREVKVNWSGHLVTLPLFPVKEIVSVFEGDAELTEDEYTASNYSQKSIVVNSVSCSGQRYWYPIGGGVEITNTNTPGKEAMYTVNFIAGHLVLPNDLKDAVAVHVVFLFQRRGEPGINPHDSGALNMVRSYSKNLALQ